jgi:hypothetical protein
VLEIRERPPSTLKNVNDRPLGGGTGDPRAPTINTKKVDDGPLGGVDGDPRALTINAKKC